MKKNIIVIGVLLIIIGCKNQIAGHWHVKTEEKNSPTFSIDIYENSNCYLTHSLNSNPVKGKHFPEEKGIFFPSDCGMFAFDYKVINGKLHLENALGIKFIAKKETKFCNRFLEYNTLLNIDYLKIEKTRGNYLPTDSIANEHLNVYINIDYSKKNKSLMLEYFDKINSINKLDSIIKYIENSHSNAELPFLNFILTPDKNIKAKDLKLFINELNKENEKSIFIRTLKAQINQWRVFEYIQIEKVILEQDLLLKEIIN
ncbi:MAG: hypothetical protein JXQ93_12775 [Flavobacteriaceae bacterium]